MKLAWIEDLLALVDAGTFSRAAVLRNVTQPAFSRRIQLLEAWLDVELIDRRSQPMRLSAVAERHIPEFRTLLNDLNRLRNRIRVKNDGLARVVLATQHSLTMTRLPAILKLLGRNRNSQIELNVRSENRDECVALFMQGHADLLLCMEEADDLLSHLMPDAGRLDMGAETLIPVSAVDRKGIPLHAPRHGATLKLLAFPLDSFLGRIMYKHCVGALLRQHAVEVVHESVFLAGIKEMVMAGLGMAWLPESLIRRELQSGSLVALEDEMKSVSLQLGLYRNARSTSPEAIDQLWRLLDKPLTP
jgi:DNA-binding transcriptional LysR family regulator